MKRCVDCGEDMRRMLDVSGDDTLARDLSALVTEATEGNWLQHYCDGHATSGADEGGE